MEYLKHYAERRTEFDATKKDEEELRSKLKIAVRVRSQAFQRWWFNYRQQWADKLVASARICGTRRVVDGVSYSFTMHDSGTWSFEIRDPVDGIQVRLASNSRKLERQGLFSHEDLFDGVAVEYTKER